MFEQFTAFFQQYANAMEDRQLTILKSIYRLPFIIVHDEPKSVVSSNEELENNLKTILTSFENLAITKVEAVVRKAIHLSSDVYFTNVNWTFKDGQGDIKLSYNTSYMLNMNGQDIKIMTVIIDDENDTYLKLL